MQLATRLYKRSLKVGIHFGLMSTVVKMLEVNRSEDERNEKLKRVISHAQRTWHSQLLVDNLEFWIPDL